MADPQMKAREIVRKWMDTHGQTTIELAEDISKALREAYEQGRRDENEACWKVAAGPDEGYLHGCDCRMRIRQRFPEATPKEKE